MADTIRVISCFADIRAMRHPEGRCADGCFPALFHPGYQCRRRRSPASDADLDRSDDDPFFKRTPEQFNSRSVRRFEIRTHGSLLNQRAVLLHRHPFRPHFPPELRVPDYIIEDTLNAKGIEYKEVENLDEAMPELDILYMTRVQRERFFNEEDCIRMKDCYILDKRRWILPVMICLCSIRFRVNEISVEVDNDPRAALLQTGSVRRIRPYGSDHDFTGGGKTMLNISGLKEGFVLDHIRAGRSMDIYFKLGLDKLDCRWLSSKCAQQQQDGTQGHHQDRRQP